MTMYQTEKLDRMTRYATDKEIAGMSKVLFRVLGDKYPWKIKDRRDWVYRKIYELSTNSVMLNHFLKLCKEHRELAEIITELNDIFTISTQEDEPPKSEKSEETISPEPAGFKELLKALNIMWIQSKGMNMQEFKKFQEEWDEDAITGNYDEDYVYTGFPDVWANIKMIVGTRKASSRNIANVLTKILNKEDSGIVAQKIHDLYGTPIPWKIDERKKYIEEGLYRIMTYLFGAKVIEVFKFFIKNFTGNRTRELYQHVLYRIILGVETIQGETTEQLPTDPETIASSVIMPRDANGNPMWDRRKLYFEKAIIEEINDIEPGDQIGYELAIMKGAIKEFVLNKNPVHLVDIHIQPATSDIYFNIEFPNAENNVWDLVFGIKKAFEIAPEENMTEVKVRIDGFDGNVEIRTNSTVVKFANAIELLFAFRTNTFRINAFGDLFFDIDHGFRIDL